MFKSEGKIIYDPYRGSMKKRIEWWCVLEVDKEITRYLRYKIRKTQGLILQPPSWDAHISVVRGEQPLQHLKKRWKEYHNETLEFEYSNVVRKTGETDRHNQTSDFWFVDVEAPKLKQIRKEFGLPFDWNLHLTIGKLDK